MRGFRSGQRGLLSQRLLWGRTAPRVVWSVAAGACTGQGGQQGQCDGPLRGAKVGQSCKSSSDQGDPAGQARWQRSPRRSSTPQLPRLLTSVQQDEQAALDVRVGTRVHCRHSNRQDDCLHRRYQLRGGAQVVRLQQRLAPAAGRADVGPGQAVVKPTGAANSARQRVVHREAGELTAS